MNHLKSLPEKTEPSLIKALSSFKSILTWLGIGLLRLTSYLPYSILMNLGDGIGSLIYKVSPHRREISEINIKLCLDVKDNELDKLVKENFRAIGRGIFEMAIAWWSSDKRIKKLDTRVLNKEVLEDTQTGALVLIKHSTHLELDLRLLSQHFDLTGMYKSQTNEAINYVMVRARNNYIQGSLTNREAMKAVRWIRSGKNFLYAADQDYGLKVSKMVPFFGQTAATVTFPALFLKKEIKIVLANVSKIDDIYEIEIKNIDSSVSEEEFLFEMNKTYEEFIKKDPSGYLWMHRRFKSGQAESLYPKWTSRERRREKRRLNRNKD
jgi:KDO2-lipid IV(A) lauroyltransferase